MDFALKPSLASYCFRPDTLDVRVRAGALGAEGAVQTAIDNDDAMLALIERQAEVADRKMKEGHPTQALELLRRTHQLALTYEAPSPKGQRPLIVRLASAAVRLQICAALSKLGRHDQALEEAANATREVDSLWHTMKEAVLEADALDAVGEFPTLDAALQLHLKNPPRWLQQTLETAVQARLCQAVEMEYILPEREFQAALDASAMIWTGMLWQQEQKCKAPIVGMPLSKLSMGQEIAQLHREALQMCLSLLPREHPMRVATERAVQDAQSRWRHVLWRETSKLAPLAPSRSHSEPVLRAPKDLPPLARLPKANRQRHGLSFSDQALLRLESCSKDSWSSGFTASTFVDSLEPSVVSDSSETLAEAVEETHGEWVRHAPPGDVMYRSLPSSFAAATSGGQPATSKKMKRRPRANIQDAAATGFQEPIDPNPFRDWKKSVVHVGRMTHFQRKLQNYEGIRSLQSDMRDSSVHFRQWMKDLEAEDVDDTRLFDDRVLFTDHGICASKIGQKKKEAMRKTSDRPSELALKRAEREKELYTHLGLPMPKPGMPGSTLSSLRKLMQASVDRSPQAVAQRQKELDDKNNAELEVAQRRRESLAGMGLSMSRGKG
eukprot:gb/GFBE01034091.1/.p1 GENE.gb/GFBE01034091.1/~~gb/GFBE01034091.1/.p1  ORF type:complete len:609 (+),score=110.52 gb/GFBE01034091.1/:1-1827(+)